MNILAGFQNTWRDTTDLPPPQDKNADDYGEQLPEDVVLDTRPDKDAIDVAIADFLKHLEAQEGALCRATWSLSHLPVPGRWTQRDFLSMLQ